MKTLYESILDDQDILIGNANGEAKNILKKMQIAKDFIINTFGEKYRVSDMSVVAAHREKVTSLTYELTQDAVSAAALKKKLEPFKKEMSKLGGKFGYRTAKYPIKYTCVLFTDDSGDQIAFKQIEHRKTHSFIHILLYGKYAQLFE